MKHIFHRSFVLIAFASAINIVLIVGLSMLFGNKLAAQIDTNDSAQIIVLTALVVIILLLNITDIINYWVGGKAQEIKAKSIVGIPSKKIYSRIYLDLNILILISFMIGTLLSIGAMCFISSILEVQISFFPIIFSFVFTAVILNGYSILILKHKLKDGFMELKG